MIKDVGLIKKDATKFMKKLKELAEKAIGQQYAKWKNIQTFEELVVRIIEAETK
jgi:hypothetical protein